MRSIERPVIVLGIRIVKGKVYYVLNCENL
jgi:hypothetical protein